MPSWDRVREQVEDRQCGLGLSIAIVERSRPPSRLARAGKRLRRVVAPTEHGDEMVGEGKIGVGDCVRRVERDRFLEQAARLDHVFPREAAKVGR
jgi:hypothetical protein